MQCVVCETAPMGGPTLGYQFTCAHCGHRASNLQVSIVGGGSVIDEADRLDGLKPLRQNNFVDVLAVMRGLGLRPAARLLDVGCAHGWFLDVAKAEGHQATGIEPDAAIAAMPLASGHDVRVGFFPQALAAEERFDAISFHDVFEHLPDPPQAAAAVHEALKPGGFAILNLPSRQGVLFRVADGLSRLGWSGPMDRLWQKGFPSPHLQYFGPQGLARLMARHGLVEVYCGSLSSFSRAGLWQRLRYETTTPVWLSALEWPVLFLASFLLPVLPADISLQVFQRPVERDR